MALINALEAHGQWRYKTTIAYNEYFIFLSLARIDRMAAINVFLYTPFG